MLFPAMLIDFPNSKVCLIGNGPFWRNLNLLNVFPGHSFQSTAPPFRRIKPTPYQCSSLLTECHIPAVSFITPKYPTKIGKDDEAIRQLRSKDSSLQIAIGVSLSVALYNLFTSSLSLSFVHSHTL